MAAALETDETLDNHELVVTTAYMDQIEPGTTYKGLFVVLGKAVQVRRRTAPPVRATVQLSADSGPFCYWFLDRRGRAFQADQRTAYRYLTQNGEWKFTPRYLGATPLREYVKSRPAFEAQARLDELSAISNTDRDKMAPVLENELRVLQEQSAALIREYDRTVAATADPNVRPKGSDLVSIIAKGNDIRGNPEQIVRNSLGFSL